jgi:Eukaryotic protein of unknown function (DUF866)
MVVFILYGKADLEGVESLSLNKTNTNLCFSVRNPYDETQVREKIVVDTSVLTAPAVADHGKHREESPNHFTLKWKDATHKSTLRVLGSDSLFVEEGVADEDDLTNKTKKKKKNTGISAELQRAIDLIRDIKSDDSGQFVPMLALDCHGLEPYAFHPMGEEGEFTVISKAIGKKYTTVDLSDGDWTDYDLSTGSISVTKFESKFQ